MKKLLLPLILVLCIFIQGCALVDTAGADTESEITKTTEESGLESYDFNGEERKIHFYTGSSNYSNIESVDELQKALDELESFKGTLTATEKIVITVRFAEDFNETEEYKALLSERGSFNTAEEAHTFREKLNAYGKEYHENLFNSVTQSIELPQNCTISPIDYTPFAIISADFDEFDSELIPKLAKSELVSTVSVSFEMEPLPD